MKELDQAIDRMEKEIDRRFWTEGEWLHMPSLDDRGIDMSLRQKGGKWQLYCEELPTELSSLDDAIDMVIDAYHGDLRLKVEKETRSKVK
jgi:hypothetical protein